MILLGAREKLMLDVLLQLRLFPLVFFAEFFDIHHDHVFLVNVAL
jgi:hypothetical protein